MRTINSVDWQVWLSRLALLLALSGLPIVSLAQGATSGSLKLYPNSSSVTAGLNTLVTPTNTEVVTMGVPFAGCTLLSTDTAKFRLFDHNGAQVQVFVKPVLQWPTTKTPCLAASVRSLKVQFQFDATGGIRTYTWDLNGPRSTGGDRTEVAVQEVDSDNPKKASAVDPLIASPVWVPMKEPRVFAIHDPVYLTQAGLMPPTAPVLPGTTDKHDTVPGWFDSKWTADSLNFDYRAQTVGDVLASGYFENWLFDRVSTNYRQAMRRGDVLHYREAYTSHEFYIRHIEVTGQNTKINATTIWPDFCVGGWAYLNVSETFFDGGKDCDTKYLYVQPFKLHLGLTGDDSWQPSDNGTPTSSGVIDTREEAWVAIGNLLFKGEFRGHTALNKPAVPPAGFSEPYDNMSDGYTERKSGLGFQSLLASCELSLDPTVCGWVDTAINNMHDHQTNNPDGRGNRGYLAHSWDVHEGEYFPFLGTTTQAYAGATSITINNTINDGPNVLVVNNSIRVANGGDYRVNGTPTENPDGSWTIALSTPLTAAAGARVEAYKINQTQSANINNIIRNVDTDRAFSPWMQSNVADGVWEYYFWTDSATQKAKARDLLVGFAHALAKYAFDGIRMSTATKQAVELAWNGVNDPSTVTIFTSSTASTTGCSLVVYPKLRYTANASINHPDVNDAFLAYINLNESGSDGHGPEALFQLSAGLFFETNPLKRAALKALAYDLTEWYDRYTCTGGTLADPIRAFNWTSKPDPWGTYKYVTSFALSYSANKFVEAVSNSGAITEAVTITIGGAKFANKTFVAGTDFTVSNLPAGFTGATLTRISDTTAELTLNGTASNHQPANNVSNVSFELKDAALVNFEAARIENSKKTNIAIEFINPNVTYSTGTFTESSANNGAISAAVTLDLAGDTFTTATGAFPGGHYTVTGVPAGLSASLQANSASQAVLTLTGNATNHGLANSVNNISFAFNNGAFTTTATASSVTNYNKTFSLNFFEPSLAYSGSTFNETASSNNGSIANTLTLTLSGDTFVIPGGVMTSGVHYTVSNLPANLSAVLTGTSTTTATFSLTGTATSHGNSNEISNLTLNILPAALAFTTNMTNVPNATNSNLSINYVEPALSYGGTTISENAVTNNGVMGNNLTITLSDDTFAVPAAAMTAGVHYTVANVPAGLSAVVTGTSSTTATLALTGSATNHGNAHEISNLTLTFLPAAFTNSTSTTNIANASKSNLSIAYVEPAIAYSGMVLKEDPLTNTGAVNDTLTLTLTENTFVNAGGNLVANTHFTVANLPAGLTMNIAINGAGTQATISLSGTAAAHALANSLVNLTVTFLPAAFTNNSSANLANAVKADIQLLFVDLGLNYNYNTFVEASVNNGSVPTTLNLTLVGDTFAPGAGAMTATTHYTVANVPNGLTAVVTVVDASTATVTLTGNATAHTNANDVSNLTLNFLDAAFTGGSALAVNNSSRNNLVVDFVDVVLTYGAETFVESGTDNGTVPTVINLSVTVNPFVVTSGAMTLNTHYTVANVPAGLTVVLTATSSTTATLALTGTAAAHANVNDVSNLTLNFLNAAFSLGNAAGVLNSSKNNLVVDFMDPPPPPEPPPPSGPPVEGTLVTGTTSGLNVQPDSIITNQGTLTNLVNSGTIKGGSIGGNSVNQPTGVLENVALLPGSVVDGGSIKGTLSGEGTVKNAVLNLTGLDPNIVLGAGVKVTSETVKNVTGLNLTGVVTDAAGKIDLQKPILVNAQNQEKSALDLALESINGLFGNNSTTTSGANDNGPITIANSDLGNVVVPVAPSKITTTAEPDGAALNDKGEFNVIKNGIKITFQPSALDTPAFLSGVQGLGAAGELGSNGQVKILFDGNTFSFKFSFTATQNTAAGPVSRALNGSKLTFNETGSPTNRATYRIYVRYADGTTQTLVPFVHDVAAFDAWMTGALFQYKLDAISGIITIKDGAKVVFKGIPDYQLHLPIVGSPTNVDFSGATDINGDGLKDIYFQTGTARQIIFGVP